MKIRLVLAAVGMSFVSTSSLAQATSNHTFFPAIQRGDVAGATAMIDGDIQIADWERKRLRQRSFTPAQFFARVSSCYFRIAFAKQADPNVEVGVWMCTLTPTKEDPNLSKTILVQATYRGDRVVLESYAEQESLKPAPAPGN